MSAAPPVVAVFVFALGAFFTGTLHASVVKMSGNGFCHPPKSSWYERTKQYTAFDSLQTCLESGGKLPKGVSQASLNDASDPSEGYKRSAFGHGWSDADGDCQNSRADALIAQSTTEVRFADKSRCRVVTGRWISPYTGKVIQNSSDIDIDHVVPLRWAWEHGAYDWGKVKREQFAKDPVNLWAVELSLNRSKGAKGPDEWLPPSAQCSYVARFFRVVKQYDLQPSSFVAGWITSFLNECRR
jgi:hypothetical protein